LGRLKSRLSNRNDIEKPLDCFWGKSLYVTVAGRHSIHRLDVGVGGAAP